MYVTNSLAVDEVVSSFPPSDETGPRLPVKIREGSHLFFEGDEVSRIYQIVSGAVRLTRVLPDGRRQVIAFGFPGDVVGFPHHGEHHCDCEALTAVEVKSFSLPCITGGSCSPPLRQAFIDAALHEIAAMQDHFLMLGRKSSSERVASFLSVMSRRVGYTDGDMLCVELPMSRCDIGDFLGLTTETVSRCFTQLRKSGIIALDGAHTVLVLRPTALKALSDGEG
jgi:CRP-like cAMP-binding protein